MLKMTERSPSMVFAQRWRPITFALWQRAAALVQFSVVPIRPLRCGAVTQIPSVMCQHNNDCPLAACGHTFALAASGVPLENQPRLDTGCLR